MDIKRLLRLDWDAAAGILAAVLAIVMHFLHIVEEGVLLMIAVVLIALLFIRGLRREHRFDEMAAMVARVELSVDDLVANRERPDVVLCGPKELRAASEAFAVRARGEMIWFHVCLSMFKPQPLFDTLLRPAIENPAVESVQFILDPRQRRLWDTEVAPKLTACRGAAKVRPPVWTTIEENLSLILSDTGSNGTTEALLSFWGEPFMARTAGRDIPRYIFHVQSHSELVGRLLDLVRGYRVSG